MAYCTREDIQSRISEADLVRLTDEYDTGLVDWEKVDQAVTDAQAEVDSYCKRNHPVPFSNPVPAMVAKVCKDIAVYNVWSLKNAAPDDAEDRYGKAVVYLEKVAAGTVDLGGGSLEKIDDGGPESIKSSDSRTFTMERLEGF